MTSSWTETESSSPPDRAERESEGPEAEERQRHRVRPRRRCCGGEGLADSHPTGQSVLEVAYPALLAAFVTLAASRASRGSLAGAFPSRGLRATYWP